MFFIFEEFVGEIMSDYQPAPDEAKDFSDSLQGNKSTLEFYFDDGKVVMFGGLVQRGGERPHRLMCMAGAALTPSPCGPVHALCPARVAWPVHAARWRGARAPPTSLMPRQTRI